MDVTSVLRSVRVLGERYYDDVMGMVDWTSLVEGLFGGAAASLVVVFGLSRWLGNLWLGRILEQEKAKYGKELEQLRAEYAQELEAYKTELDRSKSLLQAEIDRSVFVTRAHLETEFEACKQIFASLAEVRFRMADIRPMLSISSPDETPEGRREKLGVSLRALMEAYDKAVTLMENLRPFYPPALYSAVQDCLRAAQGETIQVRISGDSMFTLTWYEEGQRHMDKFLGAYNRAADIIRDRISRLAVAPRG